MKRIVLVLGIISFSFASFAIPGYKMQADARPGGWTYDACHPSDGVVWWVSEQTLCDQSFFNLLNKPAGLKMASRILHPLPIKCKSIFIS